jgi:hypothetical protein
MWKAYLTVYVAVKQQPEALLPQLDFNVIEASVFGDTMQIEHPAKL